MRKGLIIHDNVDLRKLISANLGVYADVEMISAGDATAAMEFLKKYPKTAVIVTKNKMGEENTVLKVFYYVNSNKLNIPIICLGQCFKLGAEKNVRIFAELEKTIDPLIKVAAKMMGITA